MNNLRSSFIYTIVFLLGIVSLSNAQNYISIYDAATLEPLAYANVKLTEINSHSIQYTTTDDNGKFEIPFKTKTLIEATYIGYNKVRKEITPGQQAIIYAFANEQEIDEVVVTGSPKETTAEKSVYQVNVINQETLQKKSANNLAEALQNELNIQISQDGILGSQIEMQGMSGYNVKVMIDGVPVIGRMDGNIDLSQINMNNIERIEVVEGPLSAIYGTNAIAGVINLITKQNQKNKIEGAAKFYYESVGTYNVDANVGFKKNNHYINLNAGRYFFDGWNPTKNYDRDVLWNPKEQYFGGINYTYRTNKDWFHRFKTNYFQDRILNRYDPAGQLPIAFDDWYKTKRFDFTYAVNGQINKNLSINSNNAYNFFSRVKNKYKKNLNTLESILVPDTEGEDNQDTTQLNQWMSRTSIYWDNPDKIYSVQGGIDINVENGKGGRFKSTNGGNLTMVDASFFVSSSINPTEKLAIVPAIRYGYNNMYIKIPTPSLQIKYDISKNSTYRINYGMGFRTPSLKEMYLNFNDANHNVFGNPDLKPESSHSVSTSYIYHNSFNKHGLKVKTKFFYNHKYNAIVLTPDENLVYKYLNITQNTSLGFQLENSYSFKGLSLNIGISYTGLSNDLYKSDNSLKRYYFYPQLQTNASYDFKKINLSLNVFNKFMGKRYDYYLNENEEAVQLQTQAYNIMDFTVQKGFWKNRIGISAGIKNIFNVTSIVGSQTGGAHSGGNNTTQIGTGRTYFVGLKIQSKN